MQSRFIKLLCGIALIPSGALLVFAVGGNATWFGDFAVFAMLILVLLGSRLIKSYLATTD